MQRTPLLALSVLLAAAISSDLFVLWDRLRLLVERSRSALMQHPAPSGAEQCGNLCIVLPGAAPASSDRSCAFELKFEGGKITLTCEHPAENT